MSSETIVENYHKDAVKALRAYKKLAEKAIAQLHDDEFFVTLDEEANSVAMVMKHMAGNMLSRWTDFLTSDGEKPNRNRDMEFVIEPQTTKDDVIAERHRGIRPGFGYPACPDHSEKFKLFDLLGARAIGMELTEHAAMTPAASVSGLYLTHPQARYFTVGRIGEDQIAHYARRKGQSIEAVERWLGSSLGYEPVRC